MMKQVHIPILKCFDDFKFNVGKKSLVDFVKGDPNPTIDKNNLDELNSYGCLYMIDKQEISRVVDELIKNGFLEYRVVAGGFKVVVRSSKGIREIFEKKFEVGEEKSGKNIVVKHLFEETVITDEDRKVFGVFDFFLKEFNDEQKKAIVASSKSVLCVAGAGSGKTTVLTKRIEFLNKFKGVRQESFLAITFTRKAKEEMQRRLEKLGIVNARVETFNSFCERVLKKHGDKIYSGEVKVAQYKDKIAVVKGALKKLGVGFDTFYDDYFNKRQVREKTGDELFFVFVNDVFTVIDFYKNIEDEIKPFYELESKSSKKRIAKLIYDIALICENDLKRRGLRDFSDQVVDCLRLFRAHPELIPKFDHILVDEFQDVNKVQVDLLKILNKGNIFAVGDPRQAIYGWRGSEIKFILDFPKVFEGCSVVELKKNYRSSFRIVEFFNLTINGMGLANLESSKPKKDVKDVFLIEQDNEVLEKRFVLEAIKNSSVPRNEIFVLARTNKVLEGFGDFFRQNGVKFAIKSEEEYKNGEPGEDEVVLATVHSIKGMEAKEVYLVGANSLSFPNKVVDNFVFALVKNDNDYDKEAEELRLFYVAISRAKQRLVISYTGNFSKFVSKQMLELVEFKSKNKSIFDFADKHKKLDNGNSSVLKNMLKDWRSAKGNEAGVPLYMILSNSAIDDLAMFRPQNKLEMRQVNGMGEVKIARYGDELLRIING